MLLTTTQAAKVMNVPVWQVQYALKTGKILPALTTQTRRRFFHPAQLPALKELIKQPKSFVLS